MNNEGKRGERVRLVLFSSSSPSFFFFSSTSVNGQIMHRRDDETSLWLATRFLYGKQIDVAPFRGQLHNLKKMERFPIMGSKRNRIEFDKIWLVWCSHPLGQLSDILLLGFSKTLLKLLFLIVRIFQDTLKLERYLYAPVSEESIFIYFSRRW